MGRLVAGDQYKQLIVAKEDGMHGKVSLMISACLLVCISGVAQRARIPNVDGGGALSGFIDVDIRRNFGGGSLGPYTVDVLSNGIPEARTYSTPGGNAVIGPLRPGRYTVSVSGPGISTAMEEVDLSDAASRYRVVVTVNRDPNQVATGAASGSVSAEELNAPSDAKKHYGQGLKFARKKQWEKAIAEFRRATEVFPKYASAFTGLGLTYYEIHDNAKATEFLTEAIQINPSDALALRWLGKMSISERNFSAARTYLEGAVRYDPSNDELLALLAWSQLETGSTSESIKTALRVSDKSPQAAAAHFIAGRGYEISARTKEALEQYRLCIKDDPHSPNVQLAESRIANLAHK